MGALLKKTFEYTSPLIMIRVLEELDFFNKDEAEICEKAYLFYFSVQQIFNITVTGDLTESSFKSINNVLKTHNLSELSGNIDRTLMTISGSVDALFRRKLLHG